MSTTYRIGKDRTVVKRGSKVHINDSSEDIQNYYLIECNVDGICLCVKAKDETKPFDNSEYYNEGDYKTFDDSELEEGWVGEEQEYPEEEARRQEETARSAAGAGAGVGTGTGSQLPKYRIGSEEVEQGGKVHNKYTFKNFYLLRCHKGFTQIICKVQDEKMKKEPFWVPHNELAPGWLTQEQKSLAKRQREEAERRARIQKAKYIIENYRSVSFQDAVLKFPLNTVFYYISGNRLNALFVYDYSHKSSFASSNGGHFYRSRLVAHLRIYDVETENYTEVSYFVEDLPKIPVSFHTESPQLKGQQQSSSSSSSSAAGAGAGPGTQAQSKVPKDETPAEKEKRECREFLAAHGITKYKDFGKWASTGGHPNKGGDQAVFQKISDCFDKTFKKDEENRKNKENKESKENKAKSQQGGTRNSKKKAKKTRKTRKH